MSGRTTWERHPADTARFVLSTCLAVLAIVITRNAPDSVKGISADLVRLFGHLPDGVTTAVVGVLQLTALAAPIAAVLWFLRGRWTEVVLAVGDRGRCAAIARVDEPLVEDRGAAIGRREQRPIRRGSRAPAFPSSSYLAATAAAVTAIGPTLTLSWRRATWWIVAPWSRSPVSSRPSRPH